MLPFFDDDSSESSELSTEELAKVPGQDRQNPLSITQVNTVVKGVVDDLLPQVWVGGEISDLSRPQSGHIYFSLKDDHSTVRAVMWRTAAMRLKFQLKDGQQVVGLGKVDVYVPRGSYQIVFQSLQPEGEGALQVALRQLHEKLQREGLFDEDRKKPLPRFPHRIGFVTSPSGAAIRDFLEAMRTRWPMADILVIPSSVQGDGASREIIAGIRAAQRLQPHLDLLIVGRGGGSMEDLWSFNDESLVREIAKCKIPTISAVGHEIDVTLCDLAADVRALTPTDAANKAVPSLVDVLESLRTAQIRSQQAMSQLTNNLQQRLAAIQERSVLARPEEIFIRKQQQVDEQSLRLQRAIEQILKSKSQQLATLAAATDALSPLSVLARGYSLTRRSDNARVLRSIDDVVAGQQIESILTDGTIISEVRTVEKL